LLQFNGFYYHSPHGANAFIAEDMIGGHISGFGSCCDFILPCGLWTHSCTVDGQFWLT